MTKKVKKVATKVKTKVKKVATKVKKVATKVIKKVKTKVKKTALKAIEKAFKKLWNKWGKKIFKYLAQYLERKFGIAEYLARKYSAGERRNICHILKLVAGFKLNVQGWTPNIKDFAIKSPAFTSPNLKKTTGKCRPPDGKDRDFFMVTVHKQDSPLCTLTWGRHVHFCSTCCCKEGLIRMDVSSEIHMHGTKSKSIELCGKEDTGIEVELKPVKDNFKDNFKKSNRFPSWQKHAKYLCSNAFLGIDPIMRITFAFTRAVDMFEAYMGKNSTQCGSHPPPVLTQSRKRHKRVGEVISGLEGPTQSQRKMISKELNKNLKTHRLVPTFALVKKLAGVIWKQIRSRKAAKTKKKVATKKRVATKKKAANKQPHNQQPHGKQSWGNRWKSWSREAVGFLFNVPFLQRILPALGQIAIGFADALNEECLRGAEYDGLRSFGKVVGRMLGKRGEERKLLKASVMKGCGSFVRHLLNPSYVTKVLLPPNPLGWCDKTDSPCTHDRGKCDMASDSVSMVVLRYKRASRARSKKKPSFFKFMKKWYNVFKKGTKGIKQYGKRVAKRVLSSIKSVGPPQCAYIFTIRLRGCNGCKCSKLTDSDLDIRMLEQGETVHLDLCNKENNTKVHCFDPTLQKVSQHYQTKSCSTKRTDVFNSKKNLCQEWMLLNEGMIRGWFSLWRATFMSVIYAMRYKCI